jgi:hypothetical protein
MDTLTIIILIAASAGIVGLAWLGGYQIGIANGVSAERDLANRRVNGVLESLNKSKPRSKRRARK